MPSSAPITVLIPGEGESWTGFLKRMEETGGELVAVLSGRDEELALKPDVRRSFLEGSRALRDRLQIATKLPVVASEARQRGIRVLDRTKHLKLLLKDHSQLSEALRVFSPYLWRQQLTSSLQRMGVLSIPKLRIGLLVGLSAAVFLFVVLRLLPSADIRVRPREESVSQAMNILLVQSGAVIEGGSRIRTMPLLPLVVRLHRSLTSNAISKEFIGTSARVAMTIINTSNQSYSLRRGTRVINQAGMIFRLQDAVLDLPPGEEVTLVAKAEEFDLYGQITGERGNVPAGLKWEIPGLAPEERTLVYGENKQPATGGVTAYRSVLRREDLDVALHRLKQQLLASAKERIEEEKEERNAEDPARLLTVLAYPELTKSATADTVLPLQFLGQQVSSFTVEETLSYTALAYDVRAILELLASELRAHVRDGKQLVEDSLSLEHLDARVIGYDDDLQWVKLTVELVGKDRAVLDPLTPAGALFGRRVREEVAGLSREEALRIIKNMPEIEDAAIAIWPPWQRRMPLIPSNISIASE